VSHECEILAVRDQSIRERKRQNQRPMARSFVVISKPVAIVTDLNRCFIELDELQWTDADLIVADLAFLENGIERVLGKDVFDVGDEQLLMLLLVMDPESQDRF